MKKYTLWAIASFYFCMSVDAHNISRKEYYLQTNSGYSLATIVPTTAGTPINITGLIAGSETKDVNGIGSIVGNQSFRIVDNSIVIGNIPVTLCRNTNFNIPITVFGIYNIANVFTVELLSGNNVVQILGTLTQSGTIVANIPNSVPLGDYIIRVTSSNPTLTTSPTVPITITPDCICILNSSLATGNWGTAGIWSCGHVPLVTDPIQISSGHTVTLDVNGVGKSLHLNGILSQQTNKILTIQGY